MTVVLFSFYYWDFSAAFDTVQHSTLLSRLQSCYGVTGRALAWMESHLCNRKKSVAINYSVSSSHDLHFGISVSCRNIGVVFDDTLTFESHINSVYKPSVSDTSL